jgi:hypothetical protein
MFQHRSRGDRVKARRRVFELMGQAYNINVFSRTPIDADIIFTIEIIADGTVDIDRPELNYNGRVVKILRVFPTGFPPKVPIKRMHRFLS